MKLKTVFLMTTLAIIPCLRASTVMDSINGSATPPFVLYGGPLNIGWYYSPTLSYNLTGISTDFEPVPNGTGTRTVTVQIWSDRPSVGGTLLGGGTFTADSGSGGVLGATFPSVSILSGSTYFVDFLNTEGMGVNLGQWANDINNNPQPSAGATTNLGGWYSDSDGTFPTNGFVAGGAYYSVSTGNVSFSEPILFFQGSPLVSNTPEPASFGLSMAGASGLIFAMVRKRRSSSANLRS